MKKQSSIFPSIFLKKKVIKKKSLKAQHRDVRQKKKTKAALKKEFLINCQKAVEHIEVCNRIPMVNEKINHLTKALMHLEKCLAQRPGNHILRNQVKICRKELFNLERLNKKSNNNIIEILFSQEFVYN